MNPAAPDPRASILYNMALVERDSGNVDAARDYLAKSLGLRPNAEVQRVYDSLPPE